MGSISSHLLIFLFLFLLATEGFKIKSTTKVEVFPSQKPGSDSTTFKRTYSDGSWETWTCPDCYEFDKEKLHCVKTCDPTENIGPFTLTLENSTYPYANSCRKFYSCNGPGLTNCWVQPCAAHLVYNPPTNTCEYPRSVSCCEYRARSPGRLLSDL